MDKIVDLISLRLTIHITSDRHMRAVAAYGHFPQAIRITCCPAESCHGLICSAIPDLRHIRGPHYGEFLTVLCDGHSVGSGKTMGDFSCQFSIGQPPDQCDLSDYQNNCATIRGDLQLVEVDRV